MAIGRLPRPLPRPVAAPKPVTVVAAPAPAVAAADVEFDEDGRRILTAPLAAHARPVPTVMPRPAYMQPAPRPSSLPRPTFTMPSYPADPKPALAAPGALTRTTYLPPKRTPAKQAFGPDDIPF